MCGFEYKKKERKALNSSLYSLTHRNARIIKLVSLRVRHIFTALSFGKKKRQSKSSAFSYVLILKIKESEGDQEEPR